MDVEPTNPAVLSRLEDEDEGYAPISLTTLEDVRRQIDTGDRSWGTLSGVFNACYVLIQTDALGTPLMEQYARDLMRWAYDAMKQASDSDPPATRRVKLAPYERDGDKVGLSLA